MLPVTGKQNELYKKQKLCYVYKKEFSSSNKLYYKVRYHCHYTGKYRGAAYNIFIK